MKARESGMPEEAYWESFFDPDAIMDILFRTSGLAGHLVEFGCGYGTFTIPAARRTHGIVTALDIEPLMVAHIRQKAEALALPNVQADVRDFVAHGTGLGSSTQDHAIIFNLLHLEQPVALLKEAYRVLQNGACSLLFTGAATSRHHAVRLSLSVHDQSNAAHGWKKLVFGTWNRSICKTAVRITLVRSLGDDAFALARRCT